MEACNYDSRKFFLLGSRIYFGVWLLYVGLAKWIFMGPAAFTGWIGTEFAVTWSPAPLNIALGYLIMIAEPILGFLLLVGKLPMRPVWCATAMLMFLLTFGQTMLMKYDVVANNWMYLIFALVNASLSDPLDAEKAKGCCGTEKTGCCG